MSDAGLKSWASLAVQEFNPDAIQKELTQALENGELEKTLRKIWAQYVPSVYSGRMDVDTGREERKAKRLLFRPLESFLCGGDPDVVFKELKERDHPPQLCGKVFKLGEPTYSCRDCGMDPTCVLCIDCFQNSAHKKHRYRMSTSGGGGYCDCGDQEAWKTEPFCDVHKQGLNKQPENSPIDNLPSDLRERATRLFQSAMRYAVEMLTWEEEDQLPEDLRVSNRNNIFITMLFNDEVHTYEQVIQTLQRAVDCTHKEAIDFATTVDREGRSTVKDGHTNECSHAKAIIERQTSRMGSKPLRVKVMHSSVVAHETFAQKILGWLQQVISQADGLRQLFCLLSMKTNNHELSIVETMMLADTKLWKAARIQSHQLFMAGVLMDQDCKKRFAIIFAKLYPKLMQCFTEDDHDYSVCAVSESVQIFTVPTLARMLITEYNLLEVILNTFLKECEAKKNREGIFSFERQERNQSYKRAHFMLHDLKYALTCKPSPEEWNAQLRVNFMHGFKAMLKLLRCMQGMDSVTRKTGQHIEFEPEWEGGFNLQLKLSDNISIMLDWCGTDSTVLTEAFKATMEVLVQCKKDTSSVLCSVCKHSATCIKYDVSSQPVSIHLPVTRLLAGLFPRLDRFQMSPQELLKLTGDKAVDLMEPSLRCLAMLGQTQAGMWRRNGYSLLNQSNVTVAELMEQPLCTLVLVAQTQAGMWRRNGYSLLHQIYFYHNVRCRAEMYDMDIVMLQAGASLMDGNSFLIHLLHKFGLKKWSKEDYDTPKEGTHEESLRQVVTLAEECLNLLVIILSERWYPGVGKVTNEDRVKREIIHQLCIQPMPHSELTKALPEDPCHETGIEDVVDQVAVFKKPTSMTGKGMYELKPECYQEYNPYFYHYTRAEQSKAEEAQRKRKKQANQANQDLALPPPCPVTLCSTFTPMIKLLHCDVMLYLMKLVLQRALSKRSKSWSETQCEKVLHLIGLALHEERRAHYANKEFPFIEKALTGEPSLYSMLESLVGHANITHEGQKDLIVWVTKTFRDVRRLWDATSPTTSASSASPSTSRSNEKLEKEKQKKAAEARRERLQQKMHAMQKQFIEKNKGLFNETSTELPKASSDMDISQPEEPHIESPIGLGPDHSTPSVTSVIKETCILCQESQEVMHNERAMVLSAFVQKSTVLSKSRGKVIDNPDEYDPLFMPTDLVIGAHTSTCGHVMHADCWQRYFDAILAKERRRTLRFRQQSYDIEKMEFLCPLCETLSNTVIPIIPHLTTLLRDSGKSEVELSLNDWLDGIQKTVRSSIQEHKDKASEEEAFLFVPCPLSSITKLLTESVAKNFQLLFDYVYDDASAHFSDTITDMLRKFSTDVYATGLGVHPDDENIRVPIMAWSTCAFTIMTTEQCLRDEDKPLFGSLSSRHADCLSAMVRFAAVCSQIFQPDVIKKQCITLLSALLCDSADKRLQETPCLLDMDMFHYLVELSLSLPTLYAEEDASSTKLTRIPTGGLNDLHALQFTLTAHLMQIMLTADFITQETMEVESDEEADALLKVYQHILQLAGIKRSNPPSAWRLSLHVRQASLPFLRSAALFFHYLVGVKPPAELKESGQDEFTLLCQYLALPDRLSVLFEQGHVITQLINSWCQDEAVKRRLTSTKKERLIRYPLTVNQLISLPEDYSELINRVSTFTCPKSDGDDSRAPTMCLVCGRMLCSQSYCCQTELEGVTVGAATAHSHTCGAGTGIFLRVRECQVLLLSGKTKGCFYAPPYLDDYGETDQGLRRGNPLHLCSERYKTLHKFWLSHSIPEKIGHLLESNTNLLSIEWQHL